MYGIHNLTQTALHTEGTPYKPLLCTDSLLPVDSSLLSWRVYDVMQQCGVHIPGQSFIVVLIYVLFHIYN